MDEKRVKIIQLLTVTAVIFFILLLTAMVLNLVKLAGLSGKKSALEAQLTRLDEIIALNNDNIEYRNTAEYIEQYAREYLNMQGKNDIAFIGK